MLSAAEVIRCFESLPIADLDTIIGPGDPLVLAPHADDESLGCGGLLAQCVVRGRRPSILVLTDGTGSHPNSRAYPPASLRVLREREVMQAASILGVAESRVGFLGQRDTAAPMAGVEFDAGVAAILVFATAHGAGALLAPWQHDPHCDHLAAHRMAAAAASRSGLRHLAYPVWGWTLPCDTEIEGLPPRGWRLDIAAQLDLKRQAIAAHRSQYGDLIQDDPAGFQLPGSLLARFERPFETFLEQVTFSWATCPSRAPGRHREP